MKAEIRNLSKKYGELWALQPFSYTFEPGIYALLGVNGAGKSTLMKLLTDSISRTGGEILWNGEDIRRLGASYRRQVGYMPQQVSFGVSCSAGAFLNYIGYLKGMQKKQIREEADVLLEKVNLLAQKNQNIQTLSGGMKQRLLLAQALLGSPSILILDEPTAGLDPAERIRMRNRIAELSGSRIILLATHIVSDVECIADRVILMRGGRCVCEGTPARLIRDVSSYVYDVSCKKEELPALQKKYPFGRVIQSEHGITFRYAEREENPEPAANISLEEVFMYYTCFSPNEEKTERQPEK